MLKPTKDSYFCRHSLSKLSLYRPLYRFNLNLSDKTHTTFHSIGAPPERYDSDFQYAAEILITKSAYWKSES